MLKNSNNKKKNVKMIIQIQLKMKYFWRDFIFSLTIFIETYNVFITFKTL